MSFWHLLLAALAPFLAGMVVGLSWGRELGPVDAAVEAEAQRHAESMKRIDEEGERLKRGLERLEVVIDSCRRRRPE